MMQIMKSLETDSKSTIDLKSLSWYLQLHNDEQLDDRDTSRQRHFSFSRWSESSTSTRDDLDWLYLMREKTSSLGTLLKLRPTSPA